MIDACTGGNYNRRALAREIAVKTKLVVAGGGVLVAALAGIGGWYLVHTRSTDAEQTRAQEEYKLKSQPVAVSFVVTPPQNTPADQGLYISGSVPALGNWDAAGVPLKKADDGKFHATVPDLLNTMEYAFKVTRGTWGTVEADASGKDVSNHTFVAKKDAKVELQVADWIDDGKAVPGRVTMTPGVIVHKNAFQSSGLGNQRSLIVYLPPNYEKNTSQRYPVLYMNDGQNLMDEATSYQGIEWKIDEAAQNLITSGQMKPAIIVGIYNSEQRDAEFTPPLGGSAPPKANGDAYAKMVADEVKPFIDQRYRTMADRQNTMIGGGSMGGLIALHIARTQNDKFGAVVALSPWLRLNDKPVIKDLIGDGNWLKQTFVCIDMGTDPGHNYPGGAEAATADGHAMTTELEKLGLEQGKNFVSREIEGGKHNEASWSATIDQVLLTVLANPNAPTTQPAVASTAPTSPAN
jgi:predicted alpha/beta superfamily hydrolase